MPHFQFSNQVSNVCAWIGLRYNCQSHFWKFNENKHLYELTNQWNRPNTVEDERKKNERINCSFKRIKKTEITTTTTMKGKKLFETFTHIFILLINYIWTNTNNTREKHTINKIKLVKMWNVSGYNLRNWNKNENGNGKRKRVIKIY